VVIGLLLVSVLGLEMSVILGMTGVKVWWFEFGPV